MPKETKIVLQGDMFGGLPVRRGKVPVASQARETGLSKAEEPGKKEEPPWCGEGHGPMTWDRRGGRYVCEICEQKE